MPFLSSSGTSPHVTFMAVDDTASAVTATGPWLGSVIVYFHI